MFQSYALFPHLSVLDNVGFGLRQRKVADWRRKAMEALELVKLGDRAKQRPRQLSGGMQQRVALARAIVNEPDVLLLDEPLGALDLKLRREMQIELKRIQQEVGITFIHVTHDQEEAMTMADTVAVMRAGHLEQIGAPADLYDHPATTFVANFLGQSNLLPLEGFSDPGGEFVTAHAHGIGLVVERAQLPAGLVVGPAGDGDRHSGAAGHPSGEAADPRARQPAERQPAARLGDGRLVQRSRHHLPRRHAVGPGTHRDPTQRRVGPCEPG